MSQENPGIINRLQRNKIKEEETHQIEYPCGLPGEIWAMIADCLSTQDLGRFAQVCAAFHNVLSVCKGSVLKTWFRELKVQCHGEGAAEAISLLNYCEKNIRDRSALLALIDGLLQEPQDVHENDLERDINRLTAITYQNPHNNPRNIVMRSLTSLIENGDHLIARSEIIIKRDKAFDDRFRYLMYSGIGLLILGVSIIVLLKNLTNIELHKVVLIPVIIPSVLLITSPVWKNTGLVERYKDRGFWRVVDELSPEALQRLPTLRGIRNDHLSESEMVKKLLRLGARVGVATVAFTLFCLLMAFAILKMTQTNEHSIHQARP